MPPRQARAEEREPKNEAERRRAAVRARGGGQARKDVEQTRVEREPEIWIDEGPVRAAAESAADRASRPGPATKRVASPRRPGELAPDVAAKVEEVLEPRRAARLKERLLQAQVALEGERFTDSLRMARSLAKEMPQVAAVHEVIGLSSYRLGKWRDAIASLEIARNLRPRVEDLPVLADCYRALRRWTELDQVWAEIKESSPSHEVMAEGRIVYAGSLAERGDLRGAISVMTKVAAVPRRIRPHHMRQWYVLADLYDRAGDVQRAREMFRRIATIDPRFADVKARLASL